MVLLSVADIKLYNWEIDPLPISVPMPFHLSKIWRDDAGFTVDQD